MLAGCHPAQFIKLCHNRATCTLSRAKSFMSSTVDLLADIRASDNELTLAELLATGSSAGRQTHIVFCTLFAYTQLMNATFVELPAFARYRSGYLDDEEFRELQELLLQQPNKGDIIQGTGGLRKLRFADARRGKGTRGGLRVIYYWWLGGDQFWLFTLYDKDEAADLTSDERKALKSMLESELHLRSTK